MVRIRGPDRARRIDDPAIRRLIERRFTEICNGEPYDPEVHGEMIVAEQGDTIEALEQESNCNILHDLFGDSRFGDLEFSPSFEALEEHPSCYEMVFVMNDDGFGVLIFIPKQSGIDPELLAMCATYAVPATNQSF